MNKSVIDHFNTVADTEMREALIKNSKETQLNLRVDHLWQAITTAFVWANSPQGHDYWEEICQDAMDGKIEILK